MKRLAVLLGLALVFAGVGRAAFHASGSHEASLSKYVPAGPLLYLEAKDLSSLLRDWNSSPHKKQWAQSANYEVFSRSRLFLRLKGAGDQFAAAVGLPPDMDFVSQVAGEHSAMAVYDIGKLQFLYITYLPSARSMQTSLWQTRTSFETRNAGGTAFYLRRDPQLQREVAFAVCGDYLLLATREDLIAGALQLMSGKQDRTLEDEPWWTQSTTAAGTAGDLRLVLDMQSLVPNGYFRTYWVQQNITELSQYSAAVSDLFRSRHQYREERVLIRKNESQPPATAAGPAAVADLSRLVPEGTGLYVTAANPSPDACLALLETKLLAPRIGQVPASLIAPQLQMTSGEQGSSSDLETRIDQAPSQSVSTPESGANLQVLLNKQPVAASLLVQSSQHNDAAVFVKIRSTIVLAGTSEWNDSEVRSAVSEFVRPYLTASELGVGWQQKSGYQQIDGLLPVLVSVHGKYLVLSDDSALMEAVLARFPQHCDRQPLQFFAGFNHVHERTNFARLTTVVDRPGSATGGNNGGRQPQFFSENMASLSQTLADVSSETIEIRNEGSKVHQTVTYEWSR